MGWTAWETRDPLETQVKKLGVKFRPILLDHTCAHVPGFLMKLTLYSCLQNFCCTFTGRQMEGFGENGLVTTIFPVSLSLAMTPAHPLHW